MALIGFVSQALPTVQPTPHDSFIGGSLLAYPTYPPPPDEFILCKSCHHRMCFIAQIYCPLGESSYHRSLYLFVCLKQSCQVDGFNWIALRSQSLDCSSREEEKCTANDWAFGDSGDEDPDEPKEVSSWSLNTEPVQKMEMSSVTHTLRGPFRNCFIEVFDDVCSNVPNESADELSDQSGSHPPMSSLSSWVRADEIEREFVEEDDNTMEKAFSGTLSSHLASRSDQGLEEVRYHWAGFPVFNGHPPRELEKCLTCPRCHSPRVFELQLFSVLNNSLKLNPRRFDSSPAPYDLQEDELNIDWPLKIVTVLVFSCSSSCWSESDQWVQECVVVQTDTDRTCIVDELVTIHCTE